MYYEVDRLHAIREEIAVLRKEQRTIRDQLAAGEVPLHGEHYRASVQKQVVLHPLRQKPATPERSPDDAIWRATAAR